MPSHIFIGHLNFSFFKAKKLETFAGVFILHCLFLFHCPGRVLLYFENKFLVGYMYFLIHAFSF